MKRNVQGLKILPDVGLKTLTKYTKKDLEENDLWVVTYRELEFISTHFVLASQNFAEVAVFVTEGINSDNVLPVLKYAGSVELVIDKPVTKDMIDFLCNVYPEKKGIIRKNCMLGKEPLNGIL